MRLNSFTESLFSTFSSDWDSSLKTTASISTQSLLSTESRVGERAYLLVLCDFSFSPVRCGPPCWLGPAWREGAGGGIPVIDPRLLVTPQRAVDQVCDLFRAGRRALQQLAEDRPHLRPGHRRCFFPPTAAAPTARTTG